MGLTIDTGVHGRGVFTSAPIAKGTEILPFKGRLMRYAHTTPQTYAVQIGPDVYMGESGGYDDYVNHSCEPNCGLVIDGTSVHLIAIRDIEAGEELFFDYSTTMDEDDFEMACRCGSEWCRGIVRDGKHLPEVVWERYVGLGIIPGYVRDSRRKLAKSVIK